MGSLRATAHRLIVDNALTRKTLPSEFASTEAPYRVLRIGIFCDLAVAQARERLRGDRAVGTSEAEFPHVRAHLKYDITMDTSARHSTRISISRCNKSSIGPTILHHITSLLRQGRYHALIPARISRLSPLPPLPRRHWLRLGPCHALRVSRLTFQITSADLKCIPKPRLAAPHEPLI